MIGVALIGLDHQTVARPNSFCWLFLEGFIGTQSDPFVYLLTMAVFTVKQQNRAVPNICSQSLTYLLSYSSQENSLILVCVCMCVCARAPAFVAQSCLTLCNPMDSSLHGSSVYGMLILGLS